MGFLDKAKAAASDLAAKADSALNSTAAGGGVRPADADKYFRDLGVLTYLDLTGRPADAAERERVLDGLRQLEGQNALRFALQTTPPPAPGMAGSMAPPAPGMAGTMAPPAPGMAGTMAPPPAPGMAAATPPPPAPGMTPPPPAEAAPPAAPPAPPAPAPAAPATPPPPPSWASGDNA